MVHRPESASDKKDLDTCMHYVVVRHNGMTHVYVWSLSYSIFDPCTLGMSVNNLYAARACVLAVAWSMLVNPSNKIDNIVFA